MENLPKRYDYRGMQSYSPRDDWAYIQAALSPGAQFMGLGVLINAKHAQRRLEKAGLITEEMRKICQFLNW